LVAPEPFVAFEPPAEGSLQLLDEDVLASAEEQLTALPLPETLWLAEPPLPPTEELLALPELPEVALATSPEPLPLLPLGSALASPVRPDWASLEALPPFAFHCWFWLTSPPSASELFHALALDSEVEFPDVAVPPVLDPEPELLDVASASPEPLLASPDAAFELLPFMTLPLPSAL
jgi:hypothetical protein